MSPRSGFGTRPSRPAVTDVVLLDEPAAAVINEDLRQESRWLPTLAAVLSTSLIIKFSPDGGDVLSLAGVDVGVSSSIGSCSKPKAGTRAAPLRCNYRRP